MIAIVNNFVLWIDLPSCGKPKDDVKHADNEVVKTFYCLDCGEALGTGILLGLKVICPQCRMMVMGNFVSFAPLRAAQTRVFGQALI